MRCEIDHYFFTGCISKLLLDLRCMSVSCHTVWLHILINFTEQIRKLCSSSCSGSTGLGIYDQCAHINDAFFCQWICSQNRAGGIASRISYQSCSFYLISVDLAQSIYRLVDKLRTLMLNAVPFLIDRYIFNTKVRTQIDDLCLR